MAKDQLKPRLCRMLKGESGYGFHLHGEKGKSGQFIRKVEPGSPAEAAGLRAGDRVVEVNGLNVEQETHHQVVQRIKAVETETRLLVVDKETDEYLCSLRLTCTEEMVHSGILLNSNISPTKSVGSDNGEVWKPQLDLSGDSLQRHSHSFSSHGSRKWPRIALVGRFKSPAKAPDHLCGFKRTEGAVPTSLPPEERSQWLRLQPAQREVPAGAVHPLGRPRLTGLQSGAAAPGPAGGGNSVGARHLLSWGASGGFLGACHAGVFDPAQPGRSSWVLSPFHGWEEGQQK